jgi:hypothetical protein
MSRPALPPTHDGYQFHVYCSPSNVGAAALLSELAAAMSIEIEVTEDVNELPVCECMLVYLTGHTWTSGSRSTQLQQEVQYAMRLGVRLQLAHEMVGFGGQEARSGCEFQSFFSTTPQELLRGGIYNMIAVALKGGAWREVSMVLLAKALAEAPAPHQPTWPRERLNSILSLVRDSRHSISEVMPPSSWWRWPRRAKVVEVDATPKRPAGPHQQRPSPLRSSLARMLSRPSPSSSPETGGAVPRRNERRQAKAVGRWRWRERPTREEVQPISPKACVERTGGSFSSWI